MNQGNKNVIHKHFHIFLFINKILLHNYMLDLGETTDVIPLKVMK